MHEYSCLMHDGWQVYYRRKVACMIMVINTTMGCYVATSLAMAAWYTNVGTPWATKQFISNNKFLKYRSWQDYGCFQTKNWTIMNCCIVTSIVIHRFLTIIIFFNNFKSSRDANASCLFFSGICGEATPKTTPKTTPIVFIVVLVCAVCTWLFEYVICGVFTLIVLIKSMWNVCQIKMNEGQC